MDLLLTSVTGSDFWASFWDLIWWFLWAFVFFAYLFALFAVIGDVFRDHGLPGWAKALWIVFLVFVPFLTALVYLIARGRGMAARSRTARTPRVDDRDAAPAAASPSDEIAKAKALLDAGAITPEEYERLKAKALA